MKCLETHGRALLDSKHNDAASSKEENESLIHHISLLKPFVEQELFKILNYLPLISLVNFTLCESAKGLFWSPGSCISNTSHIKSITGTSL